jgi:hypothetical protein
MSSKNDNRQTARKNKGYTNQANGNIIQIIFSKISFSGIKDVVLVIKDAVLVIGVVFLAIKDRTPTPITTGTGPITIINHPKPEVPKPEVPKPEAPKPEAPKPDHSIESYPPSPAPIRQPSSTLAKSKTETPQTIVTGDNNSLVIGNWNDIDQIGKNKKTVGQTDTIPQQQSSGKKEGEVASNTPVQPTVNVPKQPPSDQMIASADPYDRPRSTPGINPGVQVSPETGSSETTSLPDINPKQLEDQRTPNPMDVQFVATTNVALQKSPWGDPLPAFPGFVHETVDEPQEGILLVKSTKPNDAVEKPLGEHTEGEVKPVLEDGEQPLPPSESLTEVWPSNEEKVIPKSEPVQTSQPIFPSSQDSETLITSAPEIDTTSGAM